MENGKCFSSSISRFTDCLHAPAKWPSWYLIGSYDHKEKHMQINRRFAEFRLALGWRGGASRLLIVSLIFSLLIPITDCKITKTVRVAPTDLREPEKEKIVGVTTLDGQD